MQFGTRYVPAALGSFSLPGEGQDEGKKKMVFFVGFPHPSPLAEGEGTSLPR